MSDNPEETVYYLRIISLFIDIATETVLKVFCTLIPEHEICKFLSSSKVKQLQKDKVITRIQCNLVNSYVPDAKKFDISLLITLLINTELLPKPDKGWKESPGHSDLSLSADLLRLRNIRNSIVAHKTKAALYKEKFERSWAELEGILIRVNITVAPETTEDLEKRIKTYRSRSLDGHDEDDYRQKLQELLHNCEDVDKLQEKFEELVGKIKEFELFFKETPEKYSRYVRLLLEGGHIVLCSILKKGLSEKRLDLGPSLFSNRAILENAISCKELLSQVFLTDDDESLNTDITTWDIIVLAHVIEVLLKPNHLNEVHIIRDARCNYADTALMTTLNKHGFDDCCEDLVSSIRVLKSSLDKEAQLLCEEQINRYRTRASDDNNTGYDEYLDRLKQHGAGIKNLSELHKETVEKLTETVRQMMDSNVCFRNAHVLDLNMVTLGESDEKKKLAEDTIDTVWQAALRRTENPEEFDGIRKEVDKILEEIRKIPDVKAIEVERRCIILPLKCFSCQGLLQAIDYLTSDNFKMHLQLLSDELEYLCNDAVVVEGHITLDSMSKIIMNPENIEKPSDEGLRLPLVCSSPEGMKAALQLLRSERITNSINVIADNLSSHVEETISLKVIPDLKELSGVFEETDNETTSGSDSLSDESDYSDRFTHKHPAEKVNASNEKLERYSPNRKEEFKRDLMSLYKKRYHFLPIGLSDGLNKLYVPPFPLTDKTHESTEPSRIHNLEELFVSEGTVSRNIYLTAKIGMGKTAFVDWLTLCWCSDDSENNHLGYEEILMKYFDYLFFVSMGELEIDEYNVDSMIYNNIVSHLGNRNTYDLAFLRDVLEHEKCLVILDGIDEYTSKAAVTTVPDIIKREKTSILTTCLPWTYERLHLDSSQIDKHVCIESLEEDTIEILSKNIISFFAEDSCSNVCGTASPYDMCMQELSEKKMDGIISSPVLLVHLLSVWIVEGHIDKSQCEIYTGVIRLLISRANMKPAFAQHLTKFKTDDPPTVECLNMCRPYHQLFVSLGHLAYTMLFCSKSEPQDQIDETEINRMFFSTDSISPSDVITAGLITGILGKASLLENFTTQSSIFFIHKSMQKYLAALYLSSAFYTEDIIAQIERICTTVSSILKYGSVFMFLSGINGDIAKNVLLRVQQVVNTGKKDEQMYNSTVCKPDKMQIKTIQNMMISCVEESRNSGQGKLEMSLEDVIIDFSCENVLYEKYLKMLLRLNSKSIKTVCVEAFELQDDESIRHPMLEQFDPCRLQTLSVSGASVLQNNPCITEYKTLRHIYLECMKFDVHTKYWNSFLALIRLPMIEGLGLECMVMDHDYFSDVLQFLNKNIALTQICLRSIQCTTHSKVCPNSSLNLISHNNLQLLEVVDVPLEIFKVNPKSLEDCTIGLLPEKTPSQVIRCLKEASNLQRLECRGLSAKSDMHVLNCALQQLESLVCLGLFFINFGDQHVPLPSKMRHFKQIKLFSVTMSVAALRRLIEKILTACQTVTVELKKCTIIPKEGFEKIKRDISLSSKFNIKENVYDSIFTFETNPSEQV